MTILLKLFCKIQTEGAFPNSFYKDIITRIPHKDHKEKENCRPVSLMNTGAKILSHQSMLPPFGLFIFYYLLYVKVSKTNIFTVDFPLISKFVVPVTLSYLESMLIYEI